MTQEFEFTDDFLELKAMLAQFCDEVSPEHVVREAMVSSDECDKALWRRLGSELGVLGLSVPEQYGGDGAGLVFTAGVVEELGAALFNGPVLGTVCMAIPALCALTDADKAKHYLAELISGERVATVALPAPHGTFDPNAITVRAHATNDSWMLNGTVTHVPDGSAADTIVVAAATDNGVALFAVDGHADELSRQQLSTLDLTRRQANITFEHCPADLLADEFTAPDVCAHTLRTACVLLAAEQVGGAQRMLDAAVAHVSSRLQFGQPVGAFQAVKHRCANMLVALEQARSAAYHAAWALQDATDDPGLAASLARVVASETYLWVSTSAIQLHGGLGFTWEGLPHLYFKRATTDSLMFGGAGDHVELVGAAVLDTPSHPSLATSVG